ncbi:protein ZNRD2-like [Lineus longissimus]|uniref:protein ZNRD2-like n=1 Tax=Lineus longissimus TaxID=88925 RepID=UPI00315D2209
MSSFMNTPEDEWVPPTEEEQQVMRARQVRSNKISKILGEYLLKGYRMLGTTCPDCDTILLRDRQQKDFCVACTEIDVLPDNKEVEHSAGNAPSSANGVPNVEFESAEQILNGDGYAGAVSDEPAPFQINGQRPSQEPRIISLTREHSRSLNSSFRAVSPVPLDFVDGAHDPRTPIYTTSPCLSRTKTVLEQKLQWATDELQRSLSVEGSIQLCTLIKVSLETLETLSKHQAKLAPEK